MIEPPKRNVQLVGIGSNYILLNISYPSYPYDHTHLGVVFGSFMYLSFNRASQLKEK